MDKKAVMEYLIKEGYTKERPLRMKAKGKVKALQECDVCGRKVRGGMASHKKTIRCQKALLGK